MKSILLNLYADRRNNKRHKTQRRKQHGGNAKRLGCNAKTHFRAKPLGVNRLLKKLIAACLIAVAVALAVKPERYLPLCLEGLNLWAMKVLPALLPFLFVTTIFSAICDLSKIAKPLSPMTSFLFRVGGYGALARIAGLMSGYPAGAKLVASLYENRLITEDEATKISVLSSTSGPTFVIGTVGIGLYADKKIGLIIFIAHAISAAIAAVIFRKYGDNRPIDGLLPKKTSVNLYSAALDSATAMLAVGTMIAVFYVISHILDDLKITYPLTVLFNLFLKDRAKAKALTAGLFECTQGCLLLSHCDNSVAMCAAVISFGGLSVLAQSIAFLQKAKVNLKIFFAGKSIQAVISYFICKILCVIFI